MPKQLEGLGRFAKLLLAATLTVAAMNPTSAAPRSICTIKDITIKQMDWRLDMDGDVRLIGEIINNCSQAVGVELESVARDAGGKVVAHTSFWPASVRNIDANGGSQAVGYFIRIPRGMKVTTVTTRVISLNLWRR